MTGATAGDLTEIALAAALVLFAILWRPAVEAWFASFARRTGWCIVALAILPVALRLALLAHHPVPIPDIYDEFGHLLVADTLRHFRLANPPHALPQFFETFFVLQQPAYSSIYPIGQGLALALGWAVFGTPWAGVLLSASAFCALCYWMLRGWTTPGWALLGGVLAVCEFGPLNQWTNSYWGGYFSATAGCLVFGALPRLRRGYNGRDAVLLGLGVGMHILSRPYESIFLVLSVVLFFLPNWRRTAVVATLVVLPAIGITLLQNKRVTGSWTTIPYALSQYQYGVPAALTFQKNPVPHRTLTREQQMDYIMQRGFGGGGYFERLAYRVRYYRFYFYAPLYIALIAFLAGIRKYRDLWILLTVVLFALGVNFFPAFQFHYMAAVVCLFVLMSVEGLRQLDRLPAGGAAARAIIYLCLFQFAFSYVFDPGIRRNSGKRVEVAREIAKIPGKLLVFVQYWPAHVFQEEWVYNAADIDHSRVVWARDLGEPEDEKLRQYYPDRAVWVLEPDGSPPRLSRWKPEPPPPPEKKEEKQTVPRLELEPVR